MRHFYIKNLKKLPVFQAIFLIILSRKTDKLFFLTLYILTKDIEVPFWV